jgi:TolA-binding protein
MPKKSFVLMMLLASSLIGISSATNHQPEVAIAQPQPPQSPQQGQLQSPNTASPTFGSEKELEQKRQTQRQLQQQQSNVGTLVQIQQDKALVDRLFPYIIQKIDGKTLAQKIDVATLLQKIDAKILAAKVIPYLDNKITMTYREGEKNMQKSDWMDLKAGCLPGEIAISGGFTGLYQNSLVKYIPNKVSGLDYWQFTFYGGEQPAMTRAGVNCLKAELGLVSDSPPPGGAPLQPPPNLR